MLSVIDLSLILLNTSCGLYSIPKESKYTAIFLSINNETQCVSLLCLSSRFMTKAPSFILGKSSYEKTPLSLDCDMVKQFESTSYEFKSTSYEFESTSYEFESTSYEFESTSYMFESMSHKFESTEIIKSMKTQVNSLKSSASPKIISPKLFGNS